MSDDQARWVRDALDRFEGPLLLYSSRLLRDPHGAQDVVQESFLRLLRADRPTVEPRLPGWLYAVARNLALDRMRRERWMERPDSAALKDRPGPAADPAERAAARERLLGRPEDGRSDLYSFGVMLHEGLKALRKRLGVPSPGVAAARGVDR